MAVPSGHDARLLVRDHSRRAGRERLRRPGRDDPDERCHNGKAQRFPPQETFDELVVIRSEELSADEGPFRAKVSEVATALEETGGVAKVVTYSSGQPGLVSPDRHATLVAVTLTEPGEDHIEDVLSAVKRFDGQAGFETSITGEFTFDQDLGKVSERDLQNGELRLAWGA